MALPTDSRRTGTKCPGRVVDRSDSIILTVVTNAWRDSDSWRIDAMAKSIQAQSYRLTTPWWVLFVVPDGEHVCRCSAPNTFNALKRHDVRIVHGNGTNLVHAVHAYFRSARPTYVLLDENFNAILEHTALEKFIWARLAQNIDAVSSWSVTYDVRMRSQRYDHRPAQRFRSPFLVRGSVLWARLQMIRSPLPASISSLLLCDLRVATLPEYLFWEDANMRKYGSTMCFQRNRAIVPATMSEIEGIRALNSANHMKPCRQATISLVIPWLEYGGADQFNVNLVQRLSKPYDVHVVVITTTDGSKQPLAGDIAAITEDVFHLNYLLPSGHARSDVTFADMIVHLSKSRGADMILLSNSEPGYLNLPEIRNRMPGLTVVDYVHSIALDWRNGGYARYSIEQKQWLDHTVVSSHGLKRWFKDEGHPMSDSMGRANLHVVYVGVDPRECTPLNKYERDAIRKQYSLDPSKPLIVFPARTAPEKNPGRFFQIIQRVLREHVEVNVIAVGGGPLLDELRSNITAAGLSKRVISTGPLGHLETLNIIRAADVMMLTSNYEGISLATFEGMAAGVVPFSTDVGAQGELVTPDVGVLVPLDDNVVPAYANALNTILYDFKTLEQMQTAARLRIMAGFDVASVPYQFKKALC